MPDLKTYRRYREIAKICISQHGANSLDSDGPREALRIRKTAAIEDYNSIVSSLAALRRKSPIPEKVKIPTSKGTDESLAFLLSDLHFGKYSEIDGKIVYNLKIAESRLKRIVGNARNLWDKYMSPTHRIEDIHVFLAGDIIDGEQIYRTQAWNSELPVIDQITTAARMLKDNLFAWASDEFANVYVHSVQGNHGEVRESGGELAFSQRTNFDTLLAAMLEFGTADMKNVHWDIGKDRLHIARVRKYGSPGAHNFFMMHKCPPNPQTSGGRSKFGGWVQRFDVDAFLTGHYHNFRIENYNGVPIIFNGAMFGAEDDYTLTLAYNGYPCQVLFSISDKRPIANVWAVDLR